MIEKAQARPGCPDGGTCHHQCASGSLTDCFRVSACAPLSGVYVNDRWPEPAPTATSASKEPQQ